MTKEELKSVLIEVREDRSVGFLTTGEILKKEYGEDVWTVKDLIPECSITALSGTPGSFKTWLTIEIARCISSGDKFLNKFEVARGTVLFIDKENHQKHIQKRLKQLGFSDDHNVIYLTDDIFVDKEEDFKKVLRAVNKFKPKLVVFDSLVRIHQGDENTSKDIAKVMGKFRVITQKGASVLFIHHHRKESSKAKKSPNSLRGSSDILAGLDSLLFVEKSSDEDLLTIEQAKARTQEIIEPFSVLIEKNKESGGIKFSYNGEYDPTKTVRDEVGKEIIELLKEKTEMSRADIIEIFSDEYSQNTIDMVLKELVPNILNKTSGPKNKFTFSLKK